MMVRTLECRPLVTMLRLHGVCLAYFVAGMALILISDLSACTDHEVTMAFDRLHAPSQSTNHMVDEFVDQDVSDEDQGQGAEETYDEDDASFLDDDHEDDDHENYEEQGEDLSAEDLSAEDQARWLRLLQEQHQWARTQAQMQAQHDLGYSADELGEEDYAFLAQQHDAEVRLASVSSMHDPHAQYAQLRVHQHALEQQRQAARQTGGGSSSSGASR
jgi:hypothetical protein